MSTQPAQTMFVDERESTSSTAFWDSHGAQSSGIPYQPPINPIIRDYHPFLTPPNQAHSTVNNNSYNIINSTMSNMHNQYLPSCDDTRSSNRNRANHGQQKNGIGTQTDNNSHNTSTIANSVPMTLHRPKIETLNVYHHVHHASSTSSVDALSLYSSPGSSRLQSPSQLFGSNALTSPDSNIKRTERNSAVTDDPLAFNHRQEYGHRRSSSFLGHSRGYKSEPQISCQHGYLEHFRRQQLQQHIKDPIHDHILAFMQTKMIEFSIRDIPIWDSAPSLRSISPNKGLPAAPPLSTQVGDVGFFNGLGGFHTIFNILNSYDENKARGLSPPPEFSQFYIEEGNTLVILRDIGDSQIYRCENLKPDTQQSVYHGRSRKYTFSVKGSKGKKCQSASAIVVLNGGKHATFHPTFRGTDIEKYISKQILPWYDHAKLLRGNTPVGNGDLLLISSTYNVKGCGMATMLDNDGDQPATTSLVCSDHTGFCYRWYHEGGNFASYARPTDALKEDGALPSGATDHCIGVQALSIRCPSEDWKRHFRKSSTNSLVGSISTLLKWRERTNKSRNYDESMNE